MNLPVQFRPNVSAEAKRIAADYDLQQPGLGNDFYTELLATIDRLEYHPYLYGVVWRQVRAAPVHRFPYSAYYEVMSDHVIIYTVVHERRSARVWQRRI
jgi:plasmid stabilization system protein ParE